MNEIKYWKCDVCGKEDNNSNNGMNASPEHVSYMGVDIGSCKGEMKLIKK